MVALSRTANLRITVTLPGPGGEIGTVSDQDAVWGAASSIDASGGSTGTYDAIGLPYGKTINVTTGEITGLAVIARPRSSVTVTRGGTAIHTFQMGVTFMAGTAAPLVSGLNLHATAATYYDSTSVATGATLISSIIARADADPDPLVGAGNICLRKIIWTGGDILKDTSLNQYTSDLTAPAWADRVIVVIDGQGALLGQVTFRHRNVQLVWVNWKITGMRGGGNLNPFYNSVGGSRNVVFNCKIGPYFHPDTVDWPSFQSNSSAAFRYLGGRTGYGAFYCHFAGQDKGGIWDNYGTHLFDIENIFSHYGEDVIRSFQAPSDGDMYIHRRGSISTRQINTNAQLHSDVGQFGAQQASGHKVTWDEECCLADVGCGRVGGTYLRAQKEGGFTGEFNITIKDTVARLNGYDFLVNGDENMLVDGVVCAPPPGLAFVGSRMSLTYGTRVAAPGPAVIKDVTVTGLVMAGDWPASGFALTGASSVYSVSSEAAIEAKFPGITGSMVTMDRYQAIYGATYYMADYTSYAMHPTTIRAAFSAQAMPVGGWAAAGCKDPATVPVSSVWGTPPATNIPSITLASVSDTVVNLTIPSGGIVYYMVDGRNDSPTPPHLMSGVEAKGSFSGASDQGDLGSTVSEWNKKRFTAGGAVTIDLAPLVARAAGTHTGYVVFENAVTGMLSLVGKASFTK